MTWELFVCIGVTWAGCAGVLAVLGPQRKRINTNPPPAYPRPPAPPAPPPVRNARRNDMDTLTITKPQLEAALLRWEQDARDGKTRSHNEADALPVKQVAAESATHLWEELGRHGERVRPNVRANLEIPGPGRAFSATTEPR